MQATTFRNVRIWDGLADSYDDRTTLTIDADRITAIGGSYHDGASRDLSGLTVIPGLMDAHVHMTLDPFIFNVDEQLSQKKKVIRRKMSERASAMVRAGITTARDLGGGKWLEVELRNRINKGELAGPRLLCAGRPITSHKGHCHFWGGAVKTVRKAKKVIDRNVAHHVDLIKIMATGGVYTKGSDTGSAQFSQKALSKIVEYAKQRGYEVAAHCHATEGIERAVVAGVTTVEHCSWMGKDGKRGDFRQHIVDAMVDHQTFVSPTIHAGWQRFTKGDNKFVELVQQQFKRMKDVGVRLIASTDAGIPNVKHEDLPRALPVFALFADLTPVEALKAATSENAKAFNIVSETGSIEVGKAADLLVLDGDPLADLTALQSPVSVFARGIEYDPRS